MLGQIFINVGYGSFGSFKAQDFLQEYTKMFKIWVYMILYFRIVN